MCPPARLLAYANTPLPPLRALKRRARNAPGLAQSPSSPQFPSQSPRLPSPRAVAFYDSLMLLGLRDNRSDFSLRSHGVNGDYGTFEAK